MNLEIHARSFAMLQHGNKHQLRKYTHRPYIVHPMSVVNLVKQVAHVESPPCGFVTVIPDSPKSA